MNRARIDSFLPPRPAGSWASLAAVLIIGYLCMFRSFSYLGLPWLRIYIGEISLAAFLFFGPDTKQGPWVWAMQLVRPLKPVRMLILLLLVCGGFEALRGWAQGYPLFTVLRDTGFNYYPLFFFLGVWIGLRDRDFVRRAVRGLAWFNGCYGAACVLFLSRVPWTVPGTGGAASPVPLFSEPSCAAAPALLGLIIFEPKPRRVWYLIVLNAFVLLGLQVRGEWFGFAVGVLIFAWLTKQIRYVAMATAPLLLLLGLMYLADFSMQSPLGRGDNVGPEGTSISTRYLVARAIAPLSKDFAATLVPAEEVDFAAGTADWRLLWWVNIWGAVHSRLSSTLLGLGYGYPLGDLNPFIEPDTFIQTPHSVFFYALAFSGWLGVALFVFLQIAIGRLLWRAYRMTGQPFGFVCWAAWLTMSIFEPFFEAPYGAIPFFLLLGAASAPALFAGMRTTANKRVAPLLSSAAAQPA